MSGLRVPWVNYEAELRVTCYLTGGIQGPKTDSRAKFGKETIAGAHRRPKWALYYSALADSGRAQDAQALLRLCSGMLALGSGIVMGEATTWFFFRVFWSHDCGIEYTTIM